MVKVMIVADHPIMRDGLRLRIQQEPDMEIAGVTCDANNVAVDFIRCRPDVTLIDLQTPAGAGFAAVHAIRKISGDAPILILEMFPGQPGVVHPLDDALIRHLSKTAPGEEIIAAIRTAAAGS
jgi:DNA-binding NarL/FixJ family response regulator